MPSGDNIQLNLWTVSGGDISRFVQKGGSTGPKTQVIMIDTRGDSTSAEALVSSSNPLPVTVASSLLPKTPFTFRQTISATKTDFALVVPGAAWRLTWVHITSKLISATPDNPSVVIGIGATTTPTNAQVVYAHQSFPMGGPADGVENLDLAEGGSGDSLLLTTGSISNDVLEIFGGGYLK